jgi:hypothetical protein
MMPTIEISGPNLPLAMRKSVALRVSSWFKARGTSPAHVLVQFTAVSADSVFSAGIPMRGGIGSADARFALVRCCVSTDRDDAFLELLAQELRAALGLDDGGLLYVRFERVARSDVYVSTTGKLVRADSRAITMPSPSIEEQA